MTLPSELRVESFATQPYWPQAFWAIQPGVGISVTDRVFLLPDTVFNAIHSWNRKESAHMGRQACPPTQGEWSSPRPNLKVGTSSY